VGHVVDTVAFILLAVLINQQCVVPLMQKPFFLEVALFIAVATDDVQVPGAAVWGLAIIASGAIGIPLRQVAVVESGDGGHLLEHVLGEAFPGNGVGFFRQYFARVCGHFGWTPVLWIASSFGERFLFELTEPCFNAHL